MEKRGERNSGSSMRKVNDLSCKKLPKKKCCKIFETSQSTKCHNFCETEKVI